jgi:hypothetical protein
MHAAEEYGSSMFVLNHFQSDANYNLFERASLNRESSLLIIANHAIRIRFRSFAIRIHSIAASHHGSELFGLNILGDF